MTEFPTVVECATTDCFMRDSFTFEYSEPEMRLDKCGHKCYGTDCGHSSGCCQRTEKIEMVCILNSCYFHFLFALCLIAR